MPATTKKPIRVTQSQLFFPLLIFHRSRQQVELFYEKPCLNRELRACRGSFKIYTTRLNYDRPMMNELFAKEYSRRRFSQKLLGLLGALPLAQLALPFLEGQTSSTLAAR